MMEAKTARASCARHWTLYLVLAALSAFAVLGCAAPLSSGRVASKPPNGSGRLRAGASVVDITPPAGLSLFGHGPEGRVSLGHRGRLRCRTLFVSDAENESIAWVVCDLAAPSGLLHRRIAERTLSAIGLGADRLILSATHTHGGPAHYFGNQSYSGPLSTQHPGFDEHVLDWLAKRIADGVVKARALAAEEGRVELAWNRGTLPLYSTRNRSLGPHCANGHQMPGQTTTCGTPAENPYAEVDKRISVLRVDRVQGTERKTLAVFAVLAMHPTTIPNTNEVYHADVFGVAARLAETRLGAESVVAIANGIEGDVSPSLRWQNWQEADRIGRVVADKLINIQRSAAPSAEFRVNRAYWEVTLPGQAVRPGGPFLCKTGELGNPVAGGAEDGRTRFWAVAVAREGATKPDRRGCHRPRRSWTAPLTKGPWAFPTVVPLLAARLGTRTLVTLPGEMTTTPGLALRRRIENESKTEVVVVGLSNEYLQYLTSETEFNAQHYEGASVIWGPHSAEFFEERASELVKALYGQTTLPRLNVVNELKFSPEPRVCRLKQEGPPTSRKLLREPFGLDAGGLVYAIDWSSNGVEQPADAGALVHLEKRESGGWVRARDRDGAYLDDTGTLVWVKKRRAFKNRWRAVWQVEPGTRGRYRFVVGQSPALVSREVEVR